MNHQGTKEQKTWQTPVAILCCDKHQPQTSIDVYFFKRVAVFFAVLAAIFLVVIFSLAWWIESSMSAVKAHLTTHRSDLRAVVERLLNEMPLDEHIKEDEFPAELRAEEVRWATRNEGHIELVVSRNPDTKMGFRIWPSEQDVFHKDKPTDIPGVYRFSYCNDLPESPTNRPD